MFPSDSGLGSAGPDHLTFDLADESKASLSFYGKRPGPGMKFAQLSMQFSTGDTDDAGDVLEAYERLILDTMRGDHTLFTTADGIESLWERSARCWMPRRGSSRTRLGAGDRTRSTSSSPRMPGGCRSSARGGRSRYTWLSRPQNRSE